MGQLVLTGWEAGTILQHALSISRKAVLERLVAPVAS
jgi:hypothetical protein